jgi:hypothetical protein
MKAILTDQTFGMTEKFIESNSISQLRDGYTFILLDKILHFLRNYIFMLFRQFMNEKASEFQ